MEGGTFTISNGGVFGSLFGTPIINPPQSAILGMHGTFDRPVAVNGKVEVRFFTFDEKSFLTFFSRMDRDSLNLSFGTPNKEIFPYLTRNRETANNFEQSLI